MRTISLYDAHHELVSLLELPARLTDAGTVRILASALALAASRGFGVLTSGIPPALHRQAADRSTAGDVVLAA